eukprot:TRINITY_DN0_c4941_g1_i1.p1 TRINITY_DN0_c4941_g1~~TRINITY_DN0_c4941_g1_i1.p1  ORF type:complete len:201 (-),score=61.37 TRINITY_DN0_c4941_g1_i1:64-666(-)
MKTISVLALLVVAGICADFPHRLDRIISSFGEVTVTIQGRQSDSKVLESTKRLAEKVHQLWDIIPVGVNQLKTIGYDGVPCDSSLRKLEFLAKTTVSNAQQQRYRLILEDTTTFLNQVVKVNQTCASLETSIENTVQLRQKDPECRAAVERAQNAFKDSISSNGGFSKQLPNEKEIRIAILNACARPIIMSCDGPAGRGN